MALQNRIFPDKRKTAIMTPVFKSGKKNDVTNYRAISILN